MSGMHELRVKSDFFARNARLITGEKEPVSVVVKNLDSDIVKTVMRKELNKAQQQFASQLDQERQKAYQQGFQDGLKQSEQKYFDQFNKSFMILKKIVDRFHAEMTNIYETEEHEMLSLILTIARKVTDMEIEMNPEIVLTMLKKGLNQINDNRSIKIQVNRQDWELVKANMETIRMQVDLPDDVEIVPTPKVEQGGCVIETENGSVDATIETQFQEIRRKLLKDDMTH